MKLNQMNADGELDDAGNDRDANARKRWVNE